MPVVKLPDLSAMQVKVKLGETEAQKVKSGQSATITIPSLGSLELSGTVSKVANVAKAISRGSKVKRVEAIVQIDSTRAGLVPGLTGLCSIVVDEVDSVIALPHECVFERDSVKVVYVREHNAFTPYAVSLALQTDDFVVVHGDLKAGAGFALREPAFSMVRWPDSLVPPVIEPEAATAVCRDSGAVELGRVDRAIPKSADGININKGN
jgi:multidrug efflux pump subunit AcrA (membrane-fusion protein)